MIVYIGIFSKTLALIFSQISKLVAFLPYQNNNKIFELWKSI